MNYLICSKYWLLGAKPNDHNTQEQHTNDRRQVIVSLNCLYDRVSLAYNRVKLPLHILQYEKR